MAVVLTPIQVEADQLVPVLNRGEMRVAEMKRVLEGLLILRQLIAVVPRVWTRLTVGSIQTRLLCRGRD